MTRWLSDSMSRKSSIDVRCVGHPELFALVDVGRGPGSHYAARGINGPIDDLLFPIHHGILYCPGIEVLPTFVLYGTDRMTGEERRWSCATT